jgi:hypothetical protein
VAVSLGQSWYFGTLLNGSDKAVADACIKVALPQAQSSQEEA